MWSYFGNSCKKEEYGEYEPEGCTSQDRFEAECCNFQIINKSGGVEIDTHFCVDDEQRKYDGEKTYSGRYRDFDYSLWRWQCKEPEPEPEPIDELDLDDGN